MSWLLAVAAVLVLVPECGANDNGLALQPPMGWRSWEFYGVNITGKIMDSTIDALALRRMLPGESVESSLLELGYTDVAVDDGWQPQHNCHGVVPGSINGGFHTANGTPIVDTHRFPGGLAACAARVKPHPQMTFSWYTNNCADSPGSCSEGGWTDPAQILTHYQGDVNATIEWGMRGVKVDSCGEFNNMTLYAELFNKTGEAVLINSCHPSTAGCTPDGAGGFKPDPWGICPYFKEDGSLVCPFHYFRISPDCTWSWDSWMGNLQNIVLFENVSRPGCWADPDMLEVGMLWNAAEDQANFAAWAITSSPLVLSFDLSDPVLMERTLPIISNREVIEVDKTWAGHPGRLVESHKSTKTLQYLWAVPCDDVRVRAQLGWTLRPIHGAASSFLGGSWKPYQVVAPKGYGCVDLNPKSPLTLKPCEAEPDPVSSSQALLYDEVSGHLGKVWNMGDGTTLGYVNIAKGDKPDVGEMNLQFTQSYGPNQPNEEYMFINGTFRDRCSDGTPAHARCPSRCIMFNTTAPPVGNDAENRVQDIGWQLWQKPLHGGAVAVLVLNRDVDQLAARLDFAKLGINATMAMGGVRVRDLYAKRDIALVTSGEYTADSIGPHDSVMLKLTPVVLAAFV